MAGKQTRIMYVEDKETGEAWIGRVRFSRTGNTAYYKDRTLRRLVRGGICGNFYDPQTAHEYWISGCKKNGQDRHYAEPGPVSIDADVADEYWKDIRGIESR